MGPPFKTEPFANLWSWKFALTLGRLVPNLARLGPNCGHFGGQSAKFTIKLGQFEREPQRLPLKLFSLLFNHLSVLFVIAFLIYFMSSIVTLSIVYCNTDLPHRIPKTLGWDSVIRRYLKPWAESAGTPSFAAAAAPII